MAPEHMSLISAALAPVATMRPDPAVNAMVTARMMMIFPGRPVAVQARCHKNAPVTADKPHRAVRGKSCDEAWCSRRRGAVGVGRRRCGIGRHAHPPGYGREHRRLSPPLRP